jgi:hypothetical protein
VGYIRNNFDGDFYSDGTSDYVAGQMFQGTIYAAKGDTFRICGTNFDIRHITQDNSETIDVVAQVIIDEPRITKGATDTITTACTLYLSGAPTEGLSNYTIYAPSGSSYFGGTLITASTVNCTTLRASNLSDNYLPYHVSDAAGLADSGYSWVSSRAVISTNLAVGTHAVGYIKNYFSGNLTSDGGSTSSHGNYFSGALTGADGDVVALTGSKFIGTIITQDHTDTIGVVSQVYLVEPQITKGATDTITLASTLYIQDSPTEGVANYAIYSASGANYFGGTIQSASTVQCTTLKATNLTDNYLPYHVSDASGLADSGYSWVSSRAQVTNNITVGTAPTGYIRNYFTGAFTSDGSSDSLYGQFFAGGIVAAAGDTAQLTGTRFGNSITTQNNADVIAIVAQVSLREPQITIGANTITTACTLYVENAPTEGVNNYAVLVQQGTSCFLGGVQIGYDATKYGTLSCDSSGNLDIALAANSATPVTFELMATNAGAGPAALLLYGENGANLSAGDGNLNLTGFSASTPLNDSVNTVLDSDYYTATSIIGAFNEIAHDTGVDARIEATIAASSTVTIDTVDDATDGAYHAFGHIEYMYTIRKSSSLHPDDCDCGILRVKIFGTGLTPEIDPQIIGTQVLSFTFDVSVSGSDLLIEVVNAEASELTFKAVKRSIVEYVGKIIA